MDEARPGAVVFALPRGGVPVAREAARILQLPLDVFLVRKIGAPQQPELALGAIASGGIRALNNAAIAALEIDDLTIETIAERERVELERQERLFTVPQRHRSMTGANVILVDDGAATGASMFAAIAAARSQQPKRVVAALPVAPAETVESMAREADAVYCLFSPRPFGSVGRWYADFSQVSDEEVRNMLA